MLSVAFDPDGTGIVSGSWNQTLWLWQIESGELLSVIEIDRRALARRSGLINEDAAPSPLVSKDLYGRNEFRKQPGACQCSRNRSGIG